MATRRLGGSLLQRVQGAERRRLVRKVISSSPAGEPADPKGTIRQRRIFQKYPSSEIQQKKEELFTSMCGAGKDYVAERRNTQLLRYLTEHVKPREDDPHWRRISRGQKMTNCVTLMGPVSCLAANFLLPEYS